ncbi:MAG TPA: hypothetical protein VEY09_12770 [Pyrinomonadaceae bacterium]|nr:hypothetical protein [Pyrinomonadaceae bacterium]
MQKAFRQALPALFVLVPLLFGCEPLAAQQSGQQPSAPADASRAAGEAHTDAAKLPARTDAATGKDDVSTCDASLDPAVAVRPARGLVASAGRAPRRAGEPRLAFGLIAPAFDEESADAATGSGREPGGQQPGGQQPGGQQPGGQQPGGQQPGGQQPGGQQPGGQPQDPNQPDPIQPLTAGQKMRRAFRGAFLSPTPYAFSAFSATLTQLGEDELPEKDFEDELGDWASRFARTFATRTTRNIFTNGVYASLFRQDPRYHRPVNKGFGARLGYAVARVFVTRDDDGNTEPNYSRFAGNMTASALANVWERSTPGHDRIGTDATLRRFGRYFIFDALSNVVFREILPTVFGK